jgi:hypothetical protein
LRRRHIDRIQGRGGEVGGDGGVEAGAADDGLVLSAGDEQHRDEEGASDTHGGASARERSRVAAAGGQPSSPSRIPLRRSARRRLAALEGHGDLQHHVLLQVVAQLAHVARPVVGAQRREERGVGLHLRRHPALAADLLDQRGDDERQVVEALAQRREVHRDHREAVVQVRAKAPGVDLAAQVAVRGRDHPHVDLLALAPAHAPHLALAQRAQELGLQLQRQLAELVEKERAPVGPLEGALALCPWRR